MKEEGVRYNEGKLRYDLVHPIAIEGLVKVLTPGSIKYTPRNWEKGMKWSKVIASLKRHLAAFEMGEDIDPETGQLHIDHLQCNAHFLSAYYKIYPQGDDRVRYFNKIKIGYDIDSVLADFSQHFHSYLNIVGKETYFWNDPVILNNFYKIESDINFWSTMPILNDPKNIYYEPCAYITSRQINLQVTKDWLDKNHFPSAPVYNTKDHSKLDLCKQLGIDFFVDDSYDNFCDLNNGGVKCFLYTQPYNLKYDVGNLRINDLKELKNKIIQ